jgi:hypothetical protein
MMSVILLTCLAPSNAGTQGFPYARDPAALSQVLQQRGPAVVVKELFEAGEPWSEVLRSIASGSQAWLEVALLLEKGADAHPAESLSDAVRDALKQNPEYVLSHMVPSFPLEALCGGPSVDDVDSYAEAVADVERVEASVRTVTLPKLRDRRDGCLRALRASRRNLKHFFGVP